MCKPASRSFLQHIENVLPALWFCNNFLMYADFFEGFAVPPLAVAAVTQHMLIPHALPLWLDAHCLAEDEARQLQRALGFHTKTFSLLYAAAISRGHSCFVAKNC